MAISQIPIFIKTTDPADSAESDFVKNHEIYSGSKSEQSIERKTGIESTWFKELDTSKFYPIYMVGSVNSTNTASYEVIDGIIPLLKCDALDDYHFVHRKVQVACKWFVEECTASHAIIIDDDTFVNWKTLHSISSFGDNDIIGHRVGNVIDMANEDWLKGKEEKFGLEIGTLLRDVDPLVLYPQGGAGIILSKNSVSTLAEHLYFEKPGYDDIQIASVIAKHKPSYTFSNWASLMIPYPMSVTNAGLETHEEYAENRPLSFLTLHDMRTASMWTTVYNRLKAE